MAQHFLSQPLKLQYFLTAVAACVEFFFFPKSEFDFIGGNVVLSSENERFPSH